MKLINLKADYTPTIAFPEFEGIKLFDANGQLIHGYKGISNVDTGQVKAVMSDKYQIMNHEQANDIMERAVKQVAPEAKARYEFTNDGGAMRIIYDLPEKYNIDVAEGDPLKTRLVGFNSVDGSRCLTFNVDFERLICTNGMKGFTTEFSFKHRHSKRVIKEAQNLELERQIEIAWAEVKTNAEHLRNNVVGYEAGMALIKETVDRKLFPKKLQTWIQEEWRRSCNNANTYQIDNGSNLWTLYNAYTSAITHSIDKQGYTMSTQQQELYGKRINNIILQAAA